MNSAQDRHFIVGIRPVRLRTLADGGLTCEVFDWTNGEMVRDLSYLARVTMGDGDVDEVSEAEFNDAIAELHANFRNTGKWT